MGKKSYSAISKEIEEMKTNGLDDDMISSVLQAKYNESSIQKIYSEALKEREEELQALEKRHENAKNIGHSNAECDPWKKPAYFVLIITSTILPFIGLIAFIYGVFKSGKRQQVVTILIVSIIGTIFWIVFGNFLGEIAEETMREIYKNF